MDNRTRTDNEPTALYRLFDAGSTLLYVGISNNFGQRWVQHAAEQVWWPEVKRQTVDWCSSRTEAAMLEKEAIKAESPKYNFAHSGRRPSERPPSLTAVIAGDLLGEQLGKQVTRRHDARWARCATPQDARLLGVPAGTAVLVVASRFTDENGELVAYRETRIPSGVGVSYEWHAAPA
jgi:hypothetical protein